MLAADPGRFERALDFMAKHGIKGLIGGGSAEGGAMHRPCWHGTMRMRAIGKHLELGSGCASVSISSSPTAESRECAQAANFTKKT